MTALHTSALRAKESLDRVRQHIHAGTFEPSAEQTIELFRLVTALTVAAMTEDEPAIRDAVESVDEFVRACCPQAGVVN